MTGSVILKCRSFCRKCLVCKTGGLSWQWSFKTGFTVLNTMLKNINCAQNMLMEEKSVHLSYICDNFELITVYSNDISAPDKWKLLGFGPGISAI